MIDIFTDYDVFLVDAYGVFWDGLGFIAGTKERLKWLVEQGKIVIILSNTTQSAAAAMEKYATHGLMQGVHYHALVTSGEVARHMLGKGLILASKKVRNYYNFGTVNTTLFAGLDYKSTSLSEAEFIYIGIPQFTTLQKQAMEGQYPFYLGSDIYWDSSESAAFSGMIAPLIASGLPVLSANPDKIAPEKCKATGQIHTVIRQGSIAAILDNAGLFVRQLGKPYPEVYAFCRKLLVETLRVAPSARTAMIGDTVATDIKGAANATAQLDWPVDGILTLTGNEAASKEHLKTRFLLEGCRPHAVITSFGMDGVIYPM